jgi:hypothetical protein
LQAAALVRAQRDEAEGPFTLLTPLPRREFATEAQLQATFREAQLVPRGTLLVLSERNRGRVERGASGPAAQQAQLQDHLAHLQSMIAEMQAANQGPAEDAGYEQLLAWEEQQGGAVSAGLNAEELLKLKARTVTAADLPPAAAEGGAEAAGAPPLERQESVKSCCICCCEFVAGDHLMTLGCGHEFHHECVSRWLRARRFCPMCKAPVGGGGGPMVPMDDDDE